MNKKYAIVTIPEGFLYDKPGNEAGLNESELTDDVLSGWAVEILEDSGLKWVKVKTFYGYEGWIFRENLKEISLEELEYRQDKSVFKMIGARSADLLSFPKVQGRICETLWQDSVVELTETNEDGTWTKVKSACGTEGWIFSAVLRERKDSDRALLVCDPENSVILTGDYAHREEDSADYKDQIEEAAQKPEDSAVKKDQIEEAAQKPEDSVANKNQIEKAARTPDNFDVYLNQAHDIISRSDEKKLRNAAVQSAMSYLGCQYRWGGKSPAGIDCSGLVFMSWLEQGIIIYRDACIKEGYPVRQIDRSELKEGDLIFFPGHVALSLGGERFIHATGFAKTPKVVINSLDPKDPDYRADLLDKVIACGTVF